MKIMQRKILVGLVIVGMGGLCLGAARSTARVDMTIFGERPCVFAYTQQAFLTGVAGALVTSDSDMRHALLTICMCHSLHAALRHGVLPEEFYKTVRLWVKNSAYDWSSQVKLRIDSALCAVQKMGYGHLYGAVGSSVKGSRGACSMYDGHRQKDLACAWLACGAFAYVRTGDTQAFAALCTAVQYLCAVPQVEFAGCVRQALEFVYTACAAGGDVPGCARIAAFDYNVLSEWSVVPLNCERLVPLRRNEVGELERCTEDECQFRGLCGPDDQHWRSFAHRFGYRDHANNCQFGLEGLFVYLAGAMYEDGGKSCPVKESEILKSMCAVIGAAQLDTIAVQELLGRIAVTHAGMPGLVYMKNLLDSPMSPIVQGHPVPVTFTDRACRVLSQPMVQRGGAAIATTLFAAGAYTLARRLPWVCDREAQALGFLRERFGVATEKVGVEADDGSQVVSARKADEHEQMFGDVELGARVDSVGPNNDQLEAALKEVSLDNIVYSQSGFRVGDMP